MFYDKKNNLPQKPSTIQAKTNPRNSTRTGVSVRVRCRIGPLKFTSYSKASPGFHSKEKRCRNEMPRNFHLDILRFHHKMTEIVWNNMELQIIAY